MRQNRNCNVPALSAGLLKGLLISAAGAFIAVFIVTAVMRMGYPFELEWMEGTVADHVSRLAEGRAMYVPPSVRFIPFGYTPLYFYMAAAFRACSSGGFFPLRLISFLSSLGCLALLFLYVRRETRSMTAAWLAAGLFSATYALSGTWFDIARPDMLFLFLFMAAFFILRYSESAGSAVIAGFLIALAFLTKQSALAVSLPVMAGLLVYSRKQGFVFSVTIIGIIGVSTLILDRIHDGWYSVYVFDLPRARWLATAVAGKFVQFWTQDLIAPLGIALLFGLAYLYANRKEWRSRPFLLHAGLALGMIGSSCFVRIEHGGYLNSLIPAFFVCALLFGLSIPRVYAFFKNAFPGHGPAAGNILHVIMLFQFASLVYYPPYLIPSSADREAGENLIRHIAETGGDVWLTHHGYYTGAAGKGEWASLLALKNVLRVLPPDRADTLIAEFDAAIKHRKFAAVIVDEYQYPLTQLGLDRYYHRSAPVFASDDVFWPVTGRRTRPEWIYTPESRDNP